MYFQADESMSQVEASMKTGGDQQQLNSTQKHSSSDLAEGSSVALYATVNKVKLM